MEFAEYLLVLRKRWVSVVLVTLLGAALAAVAILVMPKTYTASTSLFLAVDAGSTAGELQQGGSYAESQVKSFAQIATKPVVLDPVISDLGLNTTSVELAKQITASVPTDTALVGIDVDGSDPELTQKIADATAKQLVQVVGELSPSGTNGAKMVTATIVEPAVTPTEWTSPRVVLYIALGLLLGILVGVGQAVVRTRLAAVQAGAVPVEAARAVPEA